MFSEEKFDYKEITFDLILPINDTENFCIYQNYQSLPERVLVVSSNLNSTYF